MTIPDSSRIYPRTGDTQIVYLKNVIENPNIEIGEFTIYNDFVHDPRDFQRNNVLYHYPINQDFLIKAIQDKTYIPILLELRDYSDFPGDFQEFIYHSLTALEFDLEMNYFEHGLSTGCFVFLLDGLDEVKSNRYLKLCKEIEYLCSRYKKNYYIITSRPGKGYESYFQQFTVLKCMDAHFRS